MNNFHTHTYRCKHAEGTVSEYALEAETKGLEILGFSDHTPLPDNRWLSVRMSYDQLDDYLDDIERAAGEYAGRMKILKAFECDWCSCYRDYYQEELAGKRQADYLIGAVHFFPFHGDWPRLGQIETPSQLRAYSDHLVKAMESGLFSFIAHPDAFGIGYKKWDENAVSCSADILSAASELGILLEINGYGLRKSKIDTPDGKRYKYPLNPFWEMAANFDITAVCNSDAHRPEDVAASITDARAIAEKYNVETTDMIPFINRG